jgi:Ca2+/Na+ antiporter
MMILVLVSSASALPELMSAKVAAALSTASNQVGQAEGSATAKAAIGARQMQAAEAVGAVDRHDR